MVSPHDCDLCGVPEGAGWCGNCCRKVDAESERRHRAMAKRTARKAATPARRLDGARHSTTTTTAEKEKIMPVVKVQIIPVEGEDG